MTSTMPKMTPSLMVLMIAADVSFVKGLSLGWRRRCIRRRVEQAGLPFGREGPMSVKQLYVAAALTLFGCASTGTNASHTSMSAQLTAVEIAEKHADVNTAYDAVARLRPNWLAPHGPSSSNMQGSTVASVFLDDQAMGDIQALRNIPAYQVAVIRYYDLTQAGAKFGVRAGGNGAIEVRLKQP
jgi:hypothetical protein